MVEQLGGVQTPGFGFALGLERLIQIIQEQDAEITKLDDASDVFLISVGDQARAQALVLQRDFTKAGISTILQCGQASIKNQFKKADKSGAKIALIIGEDEAQAEQVGIKMLIRREEQKTIPQNDAFNAVTNALESL